MKLIPPSQLDTNNPGSWPLFYKLILWALMLLLVFFLYNKFVRTPIMEEQEANRAKITYLESEYERLYQYQLDLPKYQKRARELVGVLQDLLVFLPSQAEMPDLIDEVYAKGTNNNITFDVFAPKTDVVEEYYNIKPIELQTTTGYTSFALFVEEISNLDRILNISNMTLTSEDTAESQKINSQLQTYIYTPDINRFIKDAGVGEHDNEN